MIKTINVPTWEEIEQRIAALPETQKQKYEELKAQFKEEAGKEKPNHERIASLMKAANELLK